MKVTNFYNSDGKLDITSLYRYSTISLKRKRFRKKFNKNPQKYVSHRIWVSYSIQVSIVNSFGRVMDLNLTPVENIDIPTGELIYSDYKYKPQS